MQFLPKKFIKPITQKPQVVYEVNLTVDVEVIDEFDEWLQLHIEKMLALPGFISAHTSVIENDDDSNRQRSVQYRLVDQAALDTYFENDAERMRADGLEKFPDQISAQRRVLTNSQAAAAEEARCANCGTLLEGRFCSSCGQREEPRVPTMLSVVKEFTNATLGLESKLWRSIFLLLFKPGQLTADYLSGKRQRYTSPLRLYLLFSIAAFAYFAFAGNQLNLEQTFIDPPDTQNSQTDTEDGNDQSQSDSETEDDFSIDGLTINSGFLADDLELQIENRTKEVAEKIKTEFEAGNGQAVLGHFLSPLPKALLIFLPFIALAFKLLYLGSGKYYIEHLIYLLHNHAFVFVLILLSVGLSEISNVLPIFEPLFSFVIVFSWLVYMPYYLYRSMRVVYQRSRLITIPSYLLIFLVYATMFALMLALSIVFAGYTYS